MTQSPAKWLAVVAVLTLLAVFSWQTVVIVVVSVAGFIAITKYRSRSSTPSCLKCGEAMKPTERWCKSCGSASQTGN